MVKHTCGWAWDKPQHEHHVCVLRTGHTGHHKCACGAHY